MIIATTGMEVVVTIVRMTQENVMFFLAKYKDTPYLSNRDRPELYSDDAIEASITLKESDNEIPFKNDLDLIINDYEMRGDHKVVELLKELIERRKLPEIIYCKDCKWYKTYSSWNCKKYYYCARESITATVKTENDFCSKAERLTDGQK